MNTKLILRVLPLTLAAITSISVASAGELFKPPTLERADILVDLDSHHNGDYKYRANTVPRRADVMAALMGSIKDPSAMTMRQRGGGSAGNALKISIAGLGFPDYVYRSGYTTATSDQQAKFAYDFAIFQIRNKVGQSQRGTDVAGVRPTERVAEVRYKALEDFAMSWWSANQPDFKQLSASSKQEWAYESLADGALLYTRYLAEKTKLSQGDLYTNLVVLESGLRKAHELNDKNLRV